VLAETLNLLRARNEFERAVVLGNDLFAGALAELIYLTPTDLQKAFVFFSAYETKRGALSTAPVWSRCNAAALIQQSRLTTISARCLA
jgi:hypothetical protein